MLQGLSAAALLGLVGCSNNDSSALSSSQASSSAEASTASSAAAGEVAISFTYTAGSSSGGGPGGGMVRNPYIAVWVEDSAGSLVKTLAVWHLQNGQDRWLSELAKWYAAAGGDSTSSGATRAPGTYTLVWDRTDTSGKTVANGTYQVFIEAIREHGPYSITSGEIAVSGKAISQTLSDNSEISAAKVTFQP